MSFPYILAVTLVVIKIGSQTWPSRMSSSPALASPDFSSCRTVIEPFPSEGEVVCYGRRSLLDLLDEILATVRCRVRC
ncbi:hypothetical protein F4821DRAFT_235947, partial [Hypoxylon rubiginosum]